MNGITSSSRRLMAVAVAALAVAALPSSAVAGNSHLLKLYKVEKHVDLQGEDDTYTVTCPSSDLAMDGMWRVDDVEQDNDYFNFGPGSTWSTTYPAGPPDHANWDVLRSVRPVKVASASPSSYDFKFTPLAGGDVQIKLWITCLGSPSESIGGHTVSWAPGNEYAGSPAAFSNQTSVGANHTQNTPAVVALATSTAYTTSSACPTGYVVTSPGFSVTAGDANLVASKPTSSADTNWNWEWRDASSDFAATHTWRCLRLKSDPSVAPVHSHRIVKKMASAFSPLNAKFKKKAVSEVQLACGEHYKGLIGGWDYSTNKVGTDYYLHFLGMDPRIKTRAFKFINKNASDQAATNLYLVCFKDKTT